ncbi:FixH family protein [Roseivirga sp. E12]|uniref:FixH family protein n=1 Tax=Roseivirga sp. E12 TaxID=2819237 RepID=UPI001ABC4AD5|nr:FixH family protein [Roseivirga sp. E12]MBO3698195.1 FixH family protein [Roseivirga sp. E12]
MNWGKKIILSFVVFIALIFTLVYVSVNTDFYLVEEDYYEQELAYEDQIQRIKNHDSLIEKPVFNIDRRAFTADLKFPIQLKKDMVEGKVLFYRSNSAKLDKEFELELNEAGEMIVDISRFAVGAWKVKIKWADGQKEYYKEIAFVI